MVVRCYFSPGWLPVREVLSCIIMDSIKKPYQYSSNSIFWVDVEKVMPNPYQPRRDFDEDRLRELASSIRQYGILQPLVVTRMEVETPEGGLATEYELIAGERRLRASKIAGLREVPVLIRVGEDSDKTKLEIAIIENLQREDLSPIDRALAFQRLKAEFKFSDKEIAKKVGRSRVYVANSMRLLNLPAGVLESLRDRKLTEGHARALLMLIDKPQEQETLHKEILLKKLSVRDVERITRKIATDKVRVHKQDVNPAIMEYENELSEKLGTRVMIEAKDYGGRVVIDYFSPDDLTNLIAIVGDGVRPDRKVKDPLALLNPKLSPIDEIALLDDSEDLQEDGQEDEKVVNDIQGLDHDKNVVTVENADIASSDAELAQIQSMPEREASESLPAQPLPPLQKITSTSVAEPLTSPVEVGETEAINNESNEDEMYSIKNFSL